MLSSTRNAFAVFVERERNPNASRKSWAAAGLEPFLLLLAASVLPVMGTQSNLVPRSQKSPRSGQMVQCLREGFVYCEKRARDLLFSAIERIVCDGEGHAPLILSRLTREAANSARQGSTPFNCPQQAPSA